MIFPTLNIRKVRLVRILSVTVITVLSEVHDALVVILIGLSMDDSQSILLYCVPHDNPLLVLMSTSDQEVMVTLQTGLVLCLTVVAVSPVHHCSSHLQLDLVLLDAVNPIEMAVEAVLTGVLLAALGADHVGVLVLEMNILDVPLQ